MRDDEPNTVRADGPSNGAGKGDVSVEERHYQLVGLVGFILAGLIFVAVGIRSADALTVIGSVVWIVACLVWLIPVMRPSRD